VVFERIGNTKQTTVLVNSFWGIIIKADEKLGLLQQFSVKRGSLWIKGFNGRGKIFFAKFGD